MHQLLQYRTWAIDESYYNTWLPVIIRGSVDKFIKPLSDEVIDARLAALLGMDEATMSLSPTRDQHTGLPVIKSGGKNIALIPIVGPLTKYGDLCNPGMQGYQAMLAKANASPSVDGIVLMMDTPGGTVDGTPELALAVKESAKPVGVFGDGMVASAGMWIASQASVIVGNRNNPTEFGSIGAMRIVQNFTNVMENGTMPQAEIITAPQSSEKLDYDPFKPMTSEKRDSLKENMRPVAQLIIDAVKEGRGEKLNADAEGLFKGRRYEARTAQKIGLIDSVGTLNTAITKVAELVKEKRKMEVAQNAAAENNTMKYPKLSSLFSGKAWGKALSAFTDDESPLAAAEAKLAQMQASEAPAKAEDHEGEEGEEGSVPMWSEDKVFNTDGSGDGAYCIHPDADGNERKFETKTDNNQGNEPPTDPATSEDDNWMVKAEEEEEQEEAPADDSESKKPAEHPAEARVAELTALTQTYETKLAELILEKTQLAARIAELEKQPIASPTVIVGGREEAVAGDNVAPRKKYYSQADAEVDQYLNFATPKNK